MSKSLIPLFTLAAFSLVLCISISDVKAAEGGYSNYIPGTYGDFAASVEPPTKWTIRNDYYNYQADGGRSFRSGQLELDAELEFDMYFLTVLYKTDHEFFGGRYAAGVFLPTVVDADIEAGVSVLGTRVARQDDVVKIK